MNFVLRNTYNSRSEVPLQWHCLSMHGGEAWSDFSKVVAQPNPTQPKLAQANQMFCRDCCRQACDYPQRSTDPHQHQTLRAARKITDGRPVKALHLKV